MPKKKTPPGVVLTYVGTRSARNVPARDLTQADIDRLAYRRALAAVAADVGQPIDREDPAAGTYARPDPRAPNPALVADVIAELTSSGLYATSTPTPAAPATTPEV